MKKILLTVGLIVALGISFGCDELIPKQECETNNTGTLSVQNNSKRGLDYSIVIDGINYGTVTFGNKGTFTVTAGPHLLEIRYAGHAGDACSASMPTVTRCQNTGLSCDG